MIARTRFDRRPATLRLFKLLRGGMPILLTTVLLSVVVTSAFAVGYYGTHYVSRLVGRDAALRQSDTPRGNASHTSVALNVAEATVSTDYPDYMPGATVMISGSGFAAGETVTLQVVHSDQTAEGGEGHQPWSVVADSTGNIASSWFVHPDDSAGSTFLLTATGNTSGLTAHTTFTDANPSADLDQYANIDGTWVNGNLGATKSTLVEGDSIPYRLVFGNLAAGSHTVVIEWDTTKSDKHALDYLTSFDRSVTTANPCDGVSGCVFGGVSPFPIPADPQVTGAGVSPAANQFFKIYGGTILSVSAYSYPDGAGFTGDKSAQIAITFNASVANPVLAWGGHIATRLDWGLSNSAVAISGSPYHTRLISLDGSGGNQDRSLSADAVIFPSSVTIIKDTVPDGPQDFGFTATGGLNPSTFTLDDDSNATLSNTQAYTNILINSATYDITETPVNGWDLSGPVCNVTSANGGSQTSIANGIRINLKEGENVTCTFTNTENFEITHGRIKVDKVTDPSGSTQSFGFTTTGSGYSNFSLKDADAPNNQQLEPGSYSVAEGSVSGWKLTNLSCSSTTNGQGQSSSTSTSNGTANVTLVAGTTVTCTYTNTQTAHLKLVKTVTNNNGGTAAAADWTLNASGPTPISGAGGAESDVDAGSYTLSESGGPSGYTAGTFSCTNGVTVTAGQITLAAGQSTVCTINNDDQTAHLKLIKHVTNDNGGKATATDWTLTADGTKDYSGAGGFDLDVDADTYALSESTGPAGYTAGSFNCGAGAVTSVTLALGQSKTCEITNNDQTAHLKLIKHVTNDNGGKASATDWTLTADGTKDYSGAGGFDLDVDADTYALSESTGPAGYTAGSFNCGAGAVTSVTLALGQSKTCEITNNDQTAHLKLIKYVVNDNGGTAVKTAWTLTADGTKDYSGAGGFDLDVDADTYALSESTGPAGYTAGSFNCGAGAVTSVTLALGQSKTCTITNNDIAPSLTLNKVVVNDNGGTAAESAWTLTATGSAGSLSGPGAAGNSDVVSGPTFKAGTYTLSESTGPWGYTASSYSCVKNAAGPVSGNSITLAVGDTATCTITNNDQPGTIIIKKIIKPEGSSTSFSFDANGTGYQDFSLSAGQMNTQTLNQGSYTVKELVPLGWTLTGIGGSIDPNTPYACTVTGSGGSTGLGDLNTQTASINLKIGDTVTCVFENTGQGATRTQGFWATHSQLAQIAWFGGSGFGHTFPGVATAIGDGTICGKPIDTLSKLMGAFWSDVSKTCTGGKRSALDQARMQLLQQLIAAELNVSAFGSVPSGGVAKFAQWEAAYCGTNQTAIKNAQQEAASFNTLGDSSTFTPGTSADSKTGRAIADTCFWNVLP